MKKKEKKNCEGKFVITRIEIGVGCTFSGIFFSSAEQKKKTFLTNDDF